MKWMIFKRKTQRGLTAGWYALHESNGVGGFFTGEGAWQRAIAFVDEQVRWKRTDERSRLVEEFDVHTLEPTC